VMTGAACTLHRNGYARNAGSEHAQKQPETHAMHGVSLQNSIHNATKMAICASLKRLCMLRKQRARSETARINRNAFKHIPSHQVE
jgi:hypothetical protein